MNALQLHTVGNVRLVEVPVPLPRPDELLIRTGAAVICTSDLNDIRANPFGIDLPVILGHEGAGTIHRVGKAVRRFRPGDRVATHPVHPCDKCANCRDGMAHLCSRMRHFGINMPGTFAEYYVVREDRARVVPANVPFGVAALAEPVCVCLQALDQARLPAEGSLLVMGDGPFGVLMARLARAQGVRKVVVAGRHGFRLSFARGAVRVNTSRVSDARAAVLAPTRGRGYDAVILAAGRADAMQQGLSLLRPKGRLVVFSAIVEPMPLDLFAVHVKELEIAGACNDEGKLDAAVAMLKKPRHGLGTLITHRFPLSEYHRALRLAQHGRDEAMKIAFTFGEGE
jgi:2-desacetyl-2-hydroxyethyl bacteriochlorophyllide A dehydrogenase